MEQKGGDLFVKFVSSFNQQFLSTTKIVALSYYQF